MPLDHRIRDELRADVDGVSPDTDRHLRRVRQRAEPGSGTIGWLVAATAAVAVIVVLVIGLRPGGLLVGPGASPAASIRPTARPSGLETGLVGTTWTVELHDSDTGAADLGVDGAWTLRLGGDSVIELVPPAGFAMPGDATALRGVYTIDDGHLVTNAFTRDFGAACAGAGSYGAEVVDGRLGLSGTDTCRIRHVILATTPWTRADP